MTGLQNIPSDNVREAIQDVENLIRFLVRVEYGQEEYLSMIKTLLDYYARHCSSEDQTIVWILSEIKQYVEVLEKENEE